uniref:Uncharacterized protein n=1 Tax=Arundo donax TaxID=35708 RepID=A0A0A9AUB9_ARUDO
MKARLAWRRGFRGLGHGCKRRTRLLHSPQCPSPRPRASSPRRPRGEPHAAPR